MGWDAQRHRPLGNGYGRSPSKYRRGRILVAANVIQVLEPDTVTYVAGAQLGLPVASYVDLYQRVYLKANSGPQSWKRTMRAVAGLVSAPAVGGAPPTAENGVWTDVSAAQVTTVGYNLALSPYEQYITPDDVAGLDYIDIKTVVTHEPRLWNRPFEVIHELWANVYVARQARTGVNAGAAFPYGNTHYYYDLTSARRPRNA
jgi:hypothetical protein